MSEEFRKRGWTVFDATDLGKVEDQLKASLGASSHDTDRRNGQ